MNFNIITLEWKRLDDIYNDNNNIDQKSGIYQFYGDSPIYGTDVLLYIGKADNLFKRINEHLKNKDSHIMHQPISSIRFAIYDGEFLDLIEKTLIVMHKPCLNSSSISRIDNIEVDKAIYIQNHYERGMLSLEVTNFYFLK